MEGLNQVAHIVTAILFIALIGCQASYARPLNGFGLENVAVTEPTQDLVLPGEWVSVSVSTKPTEEHFQRERPCDHMDSPNNLATKASSSQKLVGKYGPFLLFNLLPKGKVPPSGPSKRGNDMKD